MGRTIKWQSSGEATASVRFQMAVRKGQQDVVQMMVEDRFNVNHLYQVNREKLIC